jgi:outer membrane protein TolC
MKIRTFAFFSALSLSFLGHSAYGQTTLPDLIHYTLEHSRDVKKADLQCQEAEWMRKEIIGNGLPQAEASASYSKMVIPDISVPTDNILGMVDLMVNESVSEEVKTNMKNGITGMLNTINNIDAMYSTSIGIQVTQLIYSQSYWVGVKTAKKSQELYSILKTKSEEDVIAEVASDYYQAGSLMMQLQTVEKSLSNLKEMLRITELSYQNDLVKETTVNRLKVTIANLEVTKQTIQNAIRIQMNYIKAMAGMPSDTTFTVDTAAMINNFINNPLAIDFNVENVSSYQMLLKQDELYVQQIKLSQAKFYPTLAAFGKFSYSSYNTEPPIKDFSNMNTFGLSFSMPIFSSGSNYAKVKQAQIKRAELHEDIQKTKDLLSVSYSNALLEYQTARNTLDAQKENRELALKVYNQTVLQYQEGMASMADLLNVNSDYLQADNSYNQQILKCKTAEIKMLQASGNMKSLAK